MGSPFDSEQLLWVSSRYLHSVITEILENVKVFALCQRGNRRHRRCRHRWRQGYDNTSTFSSKIAKLKIHFEITGRKEALVWYILILLLIYPFAPVICYLLELLGGCIHIQVFTNNFCDFTFASLVYSMKTEFFPKSSNFFPLRADIQAAAWALVNMVHFR